ncbi:hypothetical protein LI82_06815 [Methanococcoides methylutens]|uniref:Uncharacterized protein n=1 Tax=Methanococcoides methylutens TaxID=2226 RepID=A0A099T324_METMT|nr:hypothetical protein [Methanococcoides methylutens]KGK98578.1 hypothetical protein LI82_06815 [Methanococcoides methylutens]
MENDPFKEIQRQIEGLKRQLQEKDEMIMDLDGQITELTAYINMLHERFTGLSLEMGELFESNPSKKRGTYARDSIVYQSESEETK